MPNESNQLPESLTYEDWPQYDQEETKRTITATLSRLTNNEKQHALERLLEDKQTFKELFTTITSAKLIDDVKRKLTAHAIRARYEQEQLKFITQLSTTPPPNIYAPNRPFLAATYVLTHAQYGTIIRYKLAPYRGEKNTIEINPAMVSEDKRTRAKGQSANGTGSKFRPLNTHHLTKTLIDLFKTPFKEANASHLNFSPPNLYVYAQSNKLGAHMDFSRKLAKEEKENLDKIAATLTANGTPITFDDNADIQYQSTKDLKKATILLSTGKLEKDGQTIQLPKLSSIMLPIT